MANVQWTETLPSNASKAGYGARDIRSMSGKIATGMQESMDWAGDGWLKPGRGHVHHATSSANSFNHGHVLFESDTTRLYLNDLETLLPSTDRSFTHLVGTGKFIEHTYEPPAFGCMVELNAAMTVTSAAGPVAFNYSTSGVTGYTQFFGSTGPDHIVFTQRPHIQLRSSHSRWHVSLGGGWRFGTVPSQTITYRDPDPRSDRDFGTGGDERIVIQVEGEGDVSNVRIPAANQDGPTPPPYDRDSDDPTIGTEDGFMWVVDTGLSTEADSTFTVFLTVTGPVAWDYGGWGDPNA